MTSAEIFTDSPFLRYSLRFTLLIAFLLFIAYKIFRLISFTRHQRQRYQDIPALPRHWALGNLKQVADKCGPQRGQHADYGFEEMWNELGRPPCFLVDIAPVEDHNFLLVAEPWVAEAVAQPSPEYKYSMPKTDTMAAMHKLIGRESLITAEGDEWRDLRRRFNRGFSPSYVHGLSPLIISKTRVFIERMQAAAREGEVLALKDMAQDLTTDIITLLAIEKDFGAQSIPEGEGPKSVFGVLTASRILSKLAASTGQGFDPIGWLNPVRRVKELVYERIYDNELYSVLSQKLQDEKTYPKKTDSSAKAIVQLALADLEPTPALMRNTVSQIKTFLFAGQDTTATLIQWLCYELSKASFDSRNREILSKLEAEHESVFGPGAYSALDVLSQPGKADELLGDKIPYTTAFIKETLRIHPPAGTARLIPEASATSPPIYIDLNGRQVAIDGLRVYNCQWLIQRNPKVWGPDAHTFRPERWLDDAYMASLPTGAWRAFERGPRNCIGQELALMEAKVVLCTVARGLRFEKVGLTGRNGEREVWNTQNVTSVPVDGMRMRFHLRE